MAIKCCVCCGSGWLNRKPTPRLVIFKEHNSKSGQRCRGLLMELEFVPADTTREAALAQLQIYRRMPPGQTLKMAMEMSDFMRDIAASGVLRRHPEYDEQQVKM